MQSSRPISKKISEFITMVVEKKGSAIGLGVDAIAGPVSEKSVDLANQVEMDMTRNEGSAQPDEFYVDGRKIASFSQVDIKNLDPQIIKYIKQNARQDGFLNNGQSALIAYLTGTRNKI